jgi:prophage tail gpP-like protein
MANPVQGQNYVVQPGDFLRTIAARAYGNQSLWRRIYDANTQAIGSDPDKIRAGTILYIPPEEAKQEQQAAAAKNRFKDRPNNKIVSLFIGDREVPTLQGRFGWALDTFASSWNADTVWNPGSDTEFDRLTARGSFADSRLYLMGQLVGTGRLYTRTAHIGTDEITKNLVFYSMTKDLVDPTLAPKWEELDDSTIQDITDNILGTLGYQAKFIDPPGEPFDYIQRQDGETIAKYLQRLAAQRGLFISCDSVGALIFQKLAQDGKSVAHIDPTGRVATDYETTYDDTARFAQYVAYATSADGTAHVGGIAKDPQVPGAREMVFKADDSDAGELDAVAEWMMLVVALKSAEIQIPVSTWTDPDGSLWTPNTMVTVKSPVLDIDRPRKMIIRAVEFSWTASELTAELSLVPILKVENGTLVMEDT